MSLLARMDKQGRIPIPAAIRKRPKTRPFIVEAGEDKIVLKPVELLSLTSLFDSIPVDDVEDFTDTHELRRALAMPGGKQQLRFPYSSVFLHAPTSSRGEG